MLLLPKELNPGRPGPNRVKAVAVVVSAGKHREATERIREEECGQNRGLGGGKAEWWKRSRGKKEERERGSEDGVPGEGIPRDGSILGGGARRGVLRSA